MSPQRLLAHFEQIGEAPDAVPRLRQFILDLAVRGKLVEQDPKDEPADELLRRIADEKKRLPKEGTIKEPKTLSPVNLKEIPYAVPVNWCWSRLGESIKNHLGGGTPSKNNADYWDGDVFWASVKDIGKTKYVDQTIDRITKAGLKDSSSNLIPPGNLIVVTRMGLGKVSINRVPLAINQDLRALFLSSLAAIDYYYIFFKTASYEGTGLTVKGIKVDELLNIPFPLPPLAEQHHIVAKVDELMKLCDELEVTQAKRERRRDRLVAATLHGLNNGVKDEDSNEYLSFDESARFYFNHLPRFTTRLEHIQQLRQTILNLAVRGKLVPQDPKDEPVENPHLEGKGKRLQPISAKEVPFGLPESWIWSRMGGYAELINGDRGKNYPNRNEYVPSGLPFINTGHIRPNGTLSLSSMHYLTRPKYDSLRSGKINSGDLVYCLRGATIGKTAIIEFEEGAIASSLVIIRVDKRLYNRYVYFYLVGSLGRSLIKRFDNGTAQPNLSADSVKQYVIPIPPLAEQHRIVAKVDDLMKLCDKLEAGITMNTTTRRRLLEATLQEALAS